MIPNIFRSWKSNFYHRDILDSLKVYTDKELSDIAAHGYNGIWLRGELNKLTSSKIFPQFGKSHKEYLRVLKALVKRAERHNIKIYIYLQEPLAVPARASFWENNKDIRGEKYFWPYEAKGTYNCLCTSTSKVRDYIRDSFYLLFKQVEGLAGIICITASEYISHCYSHVDVTGLYSKSPGFWKSFPKMQCPRCKRRRATEVVAELLNTMHEGIKKGSSSSKLIAWNWSWDIFEPDPQREIISNLNQDIVIMSDFERGGSKRILGKNRKIDEYSLSYVGPSEKFIGVRHLTRETRHELMAKMQIGTTHEVATVPNLSLINNIYKKLMYIKANDIQGIMACWNFGNMPTVNTFIFGQAIKRKSLTTKIFYGKIVRSYFKNMNSQDLSKLKRAWQLFEKAMDNYPFSIKFLYVSPINYAPVFWLLPRKIKGIPLGRSWMMDKREGDDFSQSFDGYSLREIIKGLELICQNWDKGLKIYEDVFQNHRDRYSQEEYCSALAIGHTFRSTLNLYKLYALCLKWNKKKRIKKYLALCKDELENCQSLLPLVKKDKRLGFHSECQGYMYNAKEVKNKIRRLNSIKK